MMPFFCKFFQKRNVFYLVCTEGAAIALCWMWCYPEIMPLY
jgi:hypothetical protein